MQKIQMNGGMLQQMMMLAQMVDGGSGEISAGLAQQYGMQMPGMNAPQNTENTEALGGEGGAGESEHTKKARQRVADSTSPT